MREINEAKGSLAQRVASRLAGETILSAFRMEDAEIEAYIDLINRSRAEHLMAYSDAAHRVAQYILKHDRKVRPLKSVMACAATLTENMRHVISSGFGGARVHNTYGSRDCGSMASECSRGAFHIFENRVVLEAGPNGAGRAGPILVTLLENYGFPLIRYEIGDMGTYSGETCGCGIPTRLLSSVEGRDIEFLFTSSGGYISPIYFRHLIGVVHNPGVIRQFQIVQHTMDHVELKLVAEPGAADKLLQNSVAKIRRDLVAVLGQRMTLKIEMVESIPASGSGKFIFALNRVKTPISTESQ
jgi:phenylacetate-CoA ligase